MTADEFAAAVGASPGQMADLEAFRCRLSETNAVMNLVGPASLPEFWRTHALDSAQLLSLVPEARSWADLGAGAGLPGVVLAILLKGRPGAHVWLIDSLGKRCRFLTEVVAALELPATVVNGRAEASAQPVDVVTARALAPLDRLLGYAKPWFDLGARGLFLKGAKVEEELSTARTTWRFEADSYPSLSDPRGRVLSIRGLRHAR